MKAIFLKSGCAKGVLIVLEVKQSSASLENINIIMSFNSIYWRCGGSLRILKDSSLHLK